jgi:hypothetical protein
MFDDAVPAVDGQQQRLAELPLTGGHHHTPADSEETAEYVVPVDWISTRTREHAIRQKGPFANQNSACKLRNRFTLELLYQAFGLDEISRSIPDIGPPVHPQFLSCGGVTVAFCDILICRDDVVSRRRSPLAVRLACGRRSRPLLCSELPGVNLPTRVPVNQRDHRAGPSIRIGRGW